MSNYKMQNMIEESDKHIDEIKNVVQRMKPGVNKIGEEIGKQKILLEEIGNKMDETDEKMGKTMTKLSQLLKTKDKGQIKTFIILLIISIVLFFVVIS